MSQPDLADPIGGPVDLNGKPHLYGGGGRGATGSGFDQPLRGILARGADTSEDPASGTLGRDQRGQPVYSCEG